MAISVSTRIKARDQMAESSNNRHRIRRRIGLRIGHLATCRRETVVPFSGASSGVAAGRYSLRLDSLLDSALEYAPVAWSLISAASKTLDILKG